MYQHDWDVSGIVTSKGSSGFGIASDRAKVWFHSTGESVVGCTLKVRFPRLNLREARSPP